MYTVLMPLSELALPPRARIMEPAWSVAPRELVLFTLATREICRFLVNLPTKPDPCQRQSSYVPSVPLVPAGISCPMPAFTLPKVPRIMLSCTAISMTVSRSPSSMPVNSACSDFFSTTFTFLTYLARMLRVATVGSFRKKVLPSMVMRLTSSPLTVTLPLSSTSTPGSFLSRSSSRSFSPIRCEAALYSMVSCLNSTALPAAETRAASSVCTSACIAIWPRSSVRCFRETSLVQDL